MSISEILSHALETGSTIACPYKGPHNGTCSCKGTFYVKACEACLATGYNGKLGKVCGPCGGRGCKMALKPVGEGKAK